MTRPVDVMAVMHSAHKVLLGRLHKYNNQANKAAMSGDEPHEFTLLLQDRCAYVVNEHLAAGEAVAGLLDALRKAAMALAHAEEMSPGLYSQAYQAANEAIAKATGGQP